VQKLKLFFKKSLIGGVLVLAPISILAMIAKWLFDLIRQMISPITHYLITKSNAQSELAVDFIVIALIVLLCFMVGVLVSTGVGKWTQNFFDNYLSRVAPGYRLVKDVIAQLMGDKESPFSKGEVAIAKLFGPDCPSQSTVLVTSRHDNGWYSVFVPTGPNPTSGLIYHLPPDCVELRPDIKIDEAFRTIIACGAGTAELMARKNIEVQP